MRKCFCAFLVICMIAALFPLATPADAASFLRGDLDGDGTVTAVDSLRLLQYQAGMTKYVEFDLADVNGDGSIDMVDSVLMRRHLAGLIDIGTAYPAPDTAIETVTVADENIGKYTIVVADPENANIVFAAGELQKFVKESCGRTLFVTQGNSNAPYQIVLRADDTGRLGEDGFSIDVADGVLTVTGGAARGVMYGVYEILEEYLGYRFYGSGKSELFPAETVALPNGLHDAQTPVAWYRCITIHPFHNDYVYSSVIKRKLNGATGASSLLQPQYGYGPSRLFLNAHSLDYFVPDVAAPCLSSENTYETCLANMKKLLDERIAAGGVVGKDITEISCSYSADGVYCACAQCSATYQSEGSQSGVLVPFVNRIDKALRAEYPGIRVITNAYGVARIPPKDAVLNPEVVLLYCWNGCSNHMIGSGECSEEGNLVGTTNVREEAWYLGWTEHCSQTYIWYYPTNIYYLLAPQPNLANLYNDFVWFFRHKAVGFYVVGTEGSSFEALDAYLIAELMWDGEMVEEEYFQHMDEFLAFTYGPGWENLRTYIDMITEAGDLCGCVLNDYEYPFDIYSAEYFAAHFDEMRSLFASAVDASETDGQRANLRKLSAHMEFLGLSATYDSRYVNGTAAQRSTYESEYRAWYNMMNELQIPVTYTENGISAAFTASRSPMQLVYNIDGSRR